MIPYIFLGLGAVSLGMFLFKRDKKSSIVAIALKALTSLFFLLTALFSLYENIGNNPMDNSKLLAIIFMILGLIFGMAKFSPQKSPTHPFGNSKIQKFK